MPARRRTAKSCSRNWTGMSRRRASSPIGTGPPPRSRASSTRARSAYGDLVVIESMRASIVRQRSAARSDSDPALALVDSVVVDARVAPAHVAEVVELPVLVAVAAPPLAVGVVGLVLEPDRDPVLVEAPQLLAQPVVELARPLAAQEVADGVAAGEELVAIAPIGVLGVRHRHPVGIACVPRVLGGLHL